MSCIDTSHEGEVRSDSTVHGMLHQLFAGTELEYPRIVAGPEAALEQFCEIDVLRGLYASRVMTTDHASAPYIDGKTVITGVTMSIWNSCSGDGNVQIQLHRSVIARCLLIRHQAARQTSFITGLLRNKG